MAKPDPRADEELAADAAAFRAERDARLARGGPLPLHGLAAALYAHADGKPPATRAMLTQAADVVSAESDAAPAEREAAGVDAAVALVRRWAATAYRDSEGDRERRSWCNAVAADLQSNRGFLIATARREPGAPATNEKGGGLAPAASPDSDAPGPETTRGGAKPAADRKRARGAPQQPQSEA
jgi:hypothetical protein